MKWATLISIVGLLAAPSSGVFLKEGHDYTYDYTATVSAGSNDYVNFAAVFNVTGTVHLQKTGSSSVAVKLENVKFGSYNGKFSLFPLPTFSVKEYQELNPLTEPFQVNVNGQGLVDGVVISENIPSWAKNVQRALASALQLDSSKVGETNFVVNEKTVHGVCPTTYQVIVHDPTTKTVEYRKFRSHAECQDKTVLIRRPGIELQTCKDDNSRDVFNSSSSGTYHIANVNGEPVIKKVVVNGGVQYNLFGASGHTQLSWSVLTFDLVGEPKSSGFTQIPAVSNGKTYDNVKYVHAANLDAETDDLTVPRPYFAYTDVASTDPAFLKKKSDEVTKYINELAKTLENTEVFGDLKAFHQASPVRIIPEISVLNYDSLKTLYNQFKGSGGERLKNVPLQIFLDSLVVAGTGPAALLVRDIVAETKETGLIARLIVPLPNYIRDPNEKLLKEYEVLVQKSDWTKHQGRFIDFAFASLVNRVCAKTLCKSSGSLTKWVNHFSEKYDKATHFEEKTAAIGALRNIALEGALTKLHSIVVDKSADRTVRAQAIAGLKKFGVKDPQAFKSALLPIFYDRQAHPELRNVAAVVYLLYGFNPNDLQQMVLYMWSEPNKEVKNYFYTFLHSYAHSTRPCFSKQGSYIKTALTLFPPWTVDRTLSGEYIRDYYDRQYNFGHMTHVSVQKSGESAFPTSMYVGFNGITAGVGSSYLSFFVRIEGLGKALADRIMSMTTGQINFEQVQAVFKKIGVTQRVPADLRVELALLLHNRVVAYHGVDANTITKIPDVIKKLKELQTTFDLHFTRTFLMGGAKFEESSEFGTPVSVITGATGLVGAQIKLNREMAGTSLSQTGDLHYRFGVFGFTSVSNHVPALGSVFGVAAFRTIRASTPKKYSLSLDYKQMTFNFAADVPTVKDPAIIQAHAVAVTVVRNDPTIAKEVPDVLTSSCSSCKPIEVISKGIEHRKERSISIPKIPNLGFGITEGMKGGIKYFDCEKPHSRVNTIKALAKYFSEDNKNTGGLPIWRVLLGLQYMRDSIFFSPLTQTCGIAAYRHSDPNAKSILEKIEGQVRVKHTVDEKKKLGTKVQVKASLTFKYVGPEPKTKVVDVQGQGQFQGYEKREVKVKLSSKNEQSGKTGVLCLDVATQLKKANDLLSYEGAENEPTFERNIKVVWGQESTSKDGCPTHASYVKIHRKSSRSQEQVEEAKSEAWPYNQCKAENGSPQWPGKLTPATYACMIAAKEQTHLRQSNITIEYKLDDEMKNALKTPKAILTAVLSPYWEGGSSPAVAGHHAHGAAEAGVTKVEIDVDASKENPVMDIHYHGSNGNDEHFHNVELDSLPGPLRPKAISGRFTGAYKAVKYGLFGYCVHSPGSVKTFDNTTYHADLSECPTLLAADCREKPRFAVLSRKIVADKIGLTVYLGEHVITLKDLSSAVVDKKDVPLSDSVYTDESEEVLFKIVKYTPSAVIISSEKLAVFVFYTGEYATVTIGTRYRSTSCGLCGNFDGNAQNDFTGPDSTCKSKLGPNEMMKAYIERDGSCAGVGNACPSA